MRRKIASFLYLLSLVGTICVSLAVVSLLVWVFWRGFNALDSQLFFGSTAPLLAILGQAAVFNGIFPAIVGTFWLVILSLLLAIAPGIGCGIYVSLSASSLQNWLLTSMVDIVFGISSVGV